MRTHVAASATALCLASNGLAGGVESHPFMAVWDWNEQTNQFDFSVSPVPKFDDHGGTRRLGRIRFLVGMSWETTMVLDNPLPERQCVDYSNYAVGTSLAPFGFGDVIIEVPDGFVRGRLGADPGQQVSRSVAAGGGGGEVWTRRDDDAGIIASIGTGFIAFESKRATSGFDTYRVLEADPDCNGGFRGASPEGFSTPFARFQWVASWEYHWLDADCPVDLTTANNPMHHLYGVPDGILNNEDFFYFLDQYAAGNLAVADLTTVAIAGLPGYGTPDGILSGDDFFYFLRKYVEGC